MRLTWKVCKIIQGLYPPFKLYLFTRQHWSHQDSENCLSTQLAPNTHTHTHAGSLNFFVVVQSCGKAFGVAVGVTGVSLSVSFQVQESFQPEAARAGNVTVFRHFLLFSYHQLSYIMMSLSNIDIVIFIHFLVQHSSILSGSFHCSSCAFELLAHCWALLGIVISHLSDIFIAIDIVIIVIVWHHDCHGDSLSLSNI
jgi:hypothetical protein